MPDAASIRFVPSDRVQMHLLWICCYKFVYGGTSGNSCSDVYIVVKVLHVSAVCLCLNAIGTILSTTNRTNGIWVWVCFKGDTSKQLKLPLFVRSACICILSFTRKSDLCGFINCIYDFLSLHCVLKWQCLTLIAVYRSVHTVAPACQTIS